MWAALIPAIAGLAGSVFSSSQQRDAAREANRDKTPPELQRLRAGLADWYEEQGYGPRPGYEGQMTADLNPFLQSALGGLYQNQGANANMLHQLINRFGASPSGATGWNATTPFSLRHPANRPGQSTTPHTNSQRRVRGRRGGR